MIFLSLQILKKVYRYKNDCFKIDGEEEIIFRVGDSKILNMKSE